jgi:hypothetical protein
VLTPKKHLDLDASLLRVSSIMLKELDKKGIVPFEQLRSLVVRRVGTNGDLVFLPALDFLYLLGRVEYHEKNDTLEYRAG